MRTRILIIEDQCSAAPVPWDVMFDSEYEVETADRDDHLGTRIRDLVPHLVIINSERRKNSNADLCRELRGYKESACTPILLLTDRAEESVESLDAGADDCLAKPISPREFVLRVRGLLRRAPFIRALQAADILLDLDRFRVTRAGRDIHLGPTAFKLLELLMRMAGKPVPRSELVSGVWPHKRVDERTVDATIMRLRKALRQGRRTDPIRTVPQVGYCLYSGKSSSPPESASIIYSEPSNDAKRSCTRHSAINSDRQLHTRGKRHIVA